MFDYLHYRFQLGKAYRSMNKVHIDYENDIKSLIRCNANSDDIESEKHRMWRDLQEFEEDISDIQTRYLMKIAKKRFIPTPDKKYWQESKITGTHYLDHIGISELRSLIRKERKESLDIVIPWISAISTVISLIIGLLGVIIGLISSS